MRVYRIGAMLFARTRKKAFSGEGGLHASARWHTAGHLIVYTAQSLSLAALEILVHLKQTNNIQPFCTYSVGYGPDQSTSSATRRAARNACCFFGESLPT